MVSEEEEEEDGEAEETQDSEDDEEDEMEEDDDDSDYPEEMEDDDDDDASYCTESSFRSHSTYSSTPGIPTQPSCCRLLPHLLPLLPSLTPSLVSPQPLLPPQTEGKCDGTSSGKKLDLLEERGALFKMEIALLQFAGHTLALSLPLPPPTPSFSSYKNLCQCSVSTGQG